MNLVLELTRHALLIIWTSQEFFEWVLLFVILLNFIFLSFLIYSKTSLRPFFKTMVIVGSALIAFVLFRVPDVYSSFNKGVPDNRCPTFTVDATGAIAPVKYVYLAEHVVPGPANTGFIDLFVLSHETFGKNKLVQNSHVCRIPYDESGRRLGQKIAEAAANRQGIAEELNLNDPRQAGDIEITLPGSSEEQAQLQIYLERMNPTAPGEASGRLELAESFGNAQFIRPNTQSSVKSE